MNPRRVFCIGTISRGRFSCSTVTFALAALAQMEIVGRSVKRSPTFQGSIDWVSGE
jgi:hypothetical protein